MEAPTARTVLSFLLDNIVEDATTVAISEGEGRRGNLQFTVKAASSDMGRLIGRRGRTAQNIRAVVRAAGAKDDVDVDVDFTD
jgi:uncharacterized protein